MSAIDDLYATLDVRARSGLGRATTADQPAPEGGLVRRYETGAIIWHSRTGAHEVYGDIYTQWRAMGELEGSGLGYPTTGEEDTLRGRVSHFEHGSIYWAGSAPAYAVYEGPPACREDPSQFGRWDVAAHGSGVVGVHAALVPPGRVLFFTFKPPADPYSPSAPQRYGESAILDLATNILERPRYSGPLPEQENLFCSGHAFLADGRLLIAGGERELTSVRDEPVRALHAYDPRSTSTGTLSYLGNMNAPRWYPTCATLSDGRVLIGGGSRAATYTSQANESLEVYDPGTGRVDVVVPFLDILRFHSSYPFIFALPDRRVLVHAGFTSRLLSLPSFAPEAALLEGVERYSRTYGMEGSAVLLPLLPSSTPPYRAQILVIGGGRGNINTPATATCEVLDLGDPSPAWRTAAPMAHRRVMPDAVLLPDGTLLVVNGSDKGAADAGASPVYEAELYDPARDAWTRLCHTTVPRLYHATAILLPDGRVMTAGTDGSWNPPPYNVGELRLEYFSPPYLFRRPRPSLTGAPDNVGYGTRIEVRTPDAGTIDSAVLLRCSSVTHSVNTDQRYIGLVIAGRSMDSLAIESPPDGYVAPPGYYLLFLLRGGIPSEGHFIRVGSPTACRLDVPAETGGRLMAIPDFGEVLVAASNPATSSYVRFVNTSSGLVDLRQDLDSIVTSQSLTSGAAQSVALHVIGLRNQFHLAWTLRRATHAATVRITVVNVPNGENRCTFEAVLVPS